MWLLLNFINIIILVYAYLVQWLLKEPRLDEKGVRDVQSTD